MSTLSLKPLERGIEVITGCWILNPNNELLLIKSPKWSCGFTIPGGHVEPGESVRDGAIRESLEEAGITCEFVGIISAGEIIRSKEFHREAHFVYFNVLLRTTNFDVKIDGREATGYEWVRLEDYPASAPPRQLLTAKHIREFLDGKRVLMEFSEL